MNKINVIITIIISIILTGLFLVIFINTQGIKTVQVCAKNGNCGVGFIKDKNTVITAYHNLEGDYKIHHQGYILPTGKEEIHYAKDIATIQIKGDLTGKAKYCSASVGDQVTIKVRKSRSIEEEYHGKIISKEEGWYYYVSNLDIEFGYSGSPVIKNNCVIGIIIAKRSDGAAKVTILP